MIRHATALASAFLALLATQVVAQEAPASPPPAPWGALCTSDGRSSELNCLIEQRVIASNSGALIASVSVRPMPGQDAPVLVVQVPHGLHLPAGLALAVDGANIDTLPFQTCDSQGCFVGAPAKPELIAAMKAGQNLELTFQDQGQREITVPVALVGFSAALDKAL